MTELDNIVSTAFQNPGNQDLINKAYLFFLQTLLFIPVKKEKSASTDEPFSPLFTKIENNHYMLAFDTLDRLKNWAKDAMDQIDYVELPGVDIISGINNNVYLCLNIGTDFYKEFSPDEIRHLKKIVTKVQQLKNL